MAHNWALAPIVALFLGAGCAAPNQEPSPNVERVELVAGTITVVAGNATEFHYRLPPNASETSLNGSFEVATGRIRVLVLDATGYQNFENHVADAAYYDSGNTARGSFKTVVPNGPRTYHLVFDNRFDPALDKKVTANAWIQFRS